MWKIENENVDLFLSQSLQLDVCFSNAFPSVAFSPDICWGMDLMLHLLKLAQPFVLQYEGLAQALGSQMLYKDIMTSNT